LHRPNGRCLTAKPLKCTWGCLATVHCEPNPGRQERNVGSAMLLNGRLSPNREAASPPCHRPASRRLRPTGGGLYAFGRETNAFSGPGLFASVSALMLSRL
jgi:hypothetical protein